MGSSGDSGGNSAAMMQTGTPMPNLPIAGQGGGVGDPFTYGRFQNFLPDIQAEGQNPMATGLRPEMFEYRAPGSAAGSGGGGGLNESGQIQQLRDQLAQLQSSFDAQQQYGAGSKVDSMMPGGPYTYPTGAYPNNAGG